ncbi:MAG: recombinase family protein [Desulfovibrio sp.]|nr:recombinase family protein [Desulfovibrio sp.]
MEYGFVRVSPLLSETPESGIQKQLAGIDLPEDRIFIDKSNASDKKRAVIATMLNTLTAGDVLYIGSFDRLARKLTDFVEILMTILEKDVRVHFCQENQDFTNKDSTILHFFHAVKSFINADLKERQAEGIANAKLAGVQIGRPSFVTEKQKEDVRRRLREEDRQSVAEISRLTGVPLSSCYRIRKEIELEMAKERQAKSGK